MPETQAGHEAIVLHSLNRKGGTEVIHFQRGCGITALYMLYKVLFDNNQ